MNNLGYILDDLSDGDSYSSDKDQTLLIPVGEDKRPEKDNFVFVRVYRKTNSMLRELIK